MPNFYCALCGIELDSAGAPCDPVACCARQLEAKNAQLQGSLSGEALEEAIDEATTHGRQLFAAQIMGVLAHELKGIELDTAKAIPELLFTKNALRSLAEDMGITDMPAKLWGPDMVKLISRKLEDKA